MRSVALPINFRGQRSRFRAGIVLREAKTIRTGPTLPLSISPSLIGRIDILVGDSYNGGYVNPFVRGLPTPARLLFSSTRFAPSSIPRFVTLQDGFTPSLASGPK